MRYVNVYNVVPALYMVSSNVFCIISSVYSAAIRQRDDIESFRFLYSDSKYCLLVFIS